MNKRKHLFDEVTSIVNNLPVVTKTFKQEDGTLNEATIIPNKGHASFTVKFHKPVYGYEEIGISAMGGLTNQPGKIFQIYNLFKGHLRDIIKKQIDLRYQREQLNYH